MSQSISVPVPFPTVDALADEVLESLRDGHPLDEPTDLDRRRTAFHEAGHAVMYLLGGFDLLEAVIDDELPSQRGHVSPRIAPSTRWRGLTARVAYGVLGGFVAERLAFGDVDWVGAGPDFIDLGQFQEQLSERRRVDVPRAVATTAHALSRPWIWSAVEGVAGALVERGRLGEEDLVAVRLAVRARRSSRKH